MNFTEGSFLFISHWSLEWRWCDCTAGAITINSNRPRFSSQWIYATETFLANQNPELSWSFLQIQAIVQESAPGIQKQESGGVFRRRSAILVLCTQRYEVNISFGACQDLSEPHATQKRWQNNCTFSSLMTQEYMEGFQKEVFHHTLDYALLNAWRNHAQEKPEHWRSQQLPEVMRRWRNAKFQMRQRDASPGILAKN